MRTLAKTMTAALVAGVVVVGLTAYGLSAPASAHVGNCAANPNNHYSISCLKAGMQVGPWGGFFARWQSRDLNITQTMALNGHFFAHAIWHYNNNLSEWLELGDTAGMEFDFNDDGIPDQYRWERWWYWVNGTTGYQVNEIQQSPSDDLWHTYQVQWEGSGPTQGWKLHIDGLQVAGYSQTTPVIPWRDPATFTNYLSGTGLEVTAPAFELQGSGSSNTNTVNGASVVETFEANPLQVRSAACCTWVNWAANVSQVDGPQPCSQSSGYACFNGVNSGPAVWKSNKPR